MKAIVNRSNVVISGIVFLMVLPGCDWLSKKDSQAVKAKIEKVVKEETTELEIAPAVVQNVLLSIEGRPVITVLDFEKHLNKIIASNPQVGSMMEQSPTMKYNIFSGMMSQELLSLWVEKNKIDKTDNYQQDFNMMMKLVKYELARKYFQEDVQKTVKVTATEVESFYDKNKEKISDMLLNPGGVKAKGIVFETEGRAHKFMQTVGSNANFEKHAKAEKKDLVDFGLVTQYSIDIDKSLKQELVKVAEVPSIIGIKEDDGKYWLCLVTEKEVPEYRPFVEVQDGIEKNLRNEIGHIMFGQKIEVLKTVYRAQEDKDYFDKQTVKEMLKQEGKNLPKPITEKTTSRVA